MTSLDRSAALDGLRECLGCANGSARLPQLSTHSEPALGQIRRLRPTSVLAPFVEQLNLNIEARRGKLGRPGIVTSLNDIEKFQVHLLATVTDRNGMPGYDAMPPLFKFFVLRIAHAFS